MQVERVLKRRLWQPRRAHRASVTALLNESQFASEQLQDGSIIFGHSFLRSPSLTFYARQSIRGWKVGLCATTHIIDTQSGLPSETSICVGPMTGVRKGDCVLSLCCLHFIVSSQRRTTSTEHVACKRQPARLIPIQDDAMRRSYASPRQ